MNEGCNYPIVTILAILGIIILEAIAMIYMQLDGIALSAATGSLVAIAIKRQDIEYKLRRVGKWRLPNER